jgi:hypothetical protein
MSRRWWVIIVAGVGLLAVAAVVVAFTRDNNKSKSATEWANGVCTAFAGWKSDLSAAVTTVQGNPSKDGVQQGVTDARAATSKLKDTLGSLGTPPTSAGATANQTVQTLEDQLQAGVATIGDAIDSAAGVSGVATAMSQVSSTLGTMGNQLSAAIDSLRSLPAGELQHAFETQPACVSLRSA